MTVDLPHDAMIVEKRNGGCRNGVNSGYFPGGKYIYEKSFDLDAAEIGKSVVLHFEGVYQNCKVYANGKRAGSHRYGYTAFDVDISDSVKAGNNTVRVEVDNSSKLFPYLKRGIGYSFLPYKAVKKELETGILEEVPLLGFTPPAFITYIIYRQSYSPAEFLKFAK